MSATDILSIEGACSGYRDNVVLRDATFAVAEGQVCGVIGPNGAGKTTLLRTLYGLLLLRAGVIRFAGEDVSAFGARGRLLLGLGYVPQERNVFPNLSVAENLELAMSALSPAERRARFPARRDYVFSVFPKLAERRSQNAGVMSGGEQRMVALGIGLMMKPRVLLLDEPTTGLAPMTVQLLMNTIRTLNREEGITAVIVEQNVAALLNIADSLYLVKNGNCRRFEGNPADIGNQKIWEYM